MNNSTYFFATVSFRLNHVCTPNVPSVHLEVATRTPSTTTKRWTNKMAGQCLCRHHRHKPAQHSSGKGLPLQLQGPDILQYDEERRHEEASQRADMIQ